MGLGTGKTRPNFADLLSLPCAGDHRAVCGGPDWRGRITGSDSTPSFHSAAQLGALLFCFANRVRFFFTRSLSCPGLYEEHTGL